MIQSRNCSFLYTAEFAVKKVILRIQLKLNTALLSTVSPCGYVSVCHRHI